MPKPSDGCKTVIDERSVLMPKPSGSAFFYLGQDYPIWFYSSVWHIVTHQFFFALYITVVFRIVQYTAVTILGKGSSFRCFISVLGIYNCC
jgi:hypothetical protein